MTDPAARPHGYEWRAVLLLSLGFGLVGVDRFMISAMYPVIAADLGLGYGDIGVITGVLAIAWGIAALLMGNLSDYIGRRSVLAGSLIVFSLLIGGERACDRSGRFVDRARAYGPGRWRLHSAQHISDARSFTACAAREKSRHSADDAAFVRPRACTDPGDAGA